jgi:hypothetical protein
MNDYQLSTNNEQLSMTEAIIGQQIEQYSRFS